MDTVALVTGGGSGIGAACCDRLAVGGAVVVVADLDVASAEAVAERILDAGGAASAEHVDVADSASVDDLVGRILKAHGRLDIGVNNAGIGGAQSGVAELTDAEWRETIGVNLGGVFFCMRAEIQVMRERGGGAIVNMGSILSSIAWPDAAPYVASKHGVLGLTRSAALDYAAHGIRVNAVGPGFIRTTLVQNALSPELYAQLSAMHPVQRMGEPSEVAELVAFLASPAASNITGGYYTVDGGFTVK